MNIERFHNELAMRLGYERIVNDKMILISVEESDDPVVTLKVQGGEDIRFKASAGPESVLPENQKEIWEIVDAVLQSYYKASNSFFNMQQLIFVRSQYRKRVVQGFCTF